MSHTPFYERPLVYVAGPYKSPDPVLNTHNTIKFADALQERGIVTCHVPHLTLLWHAICPHGENGDQEYWYDYDMAVLARCDALFRMPGKSTGADAEVAFAEGYDIPVYEDVVVMEQDLIRRATER